MYLICVATAAKLRIKYERERNLPWIKGVYDLISELTGVSVDQIALDIGVIAETLEAYESNTDQ